ncbi:mycothiol transferase [Micromonospora taraxaci]
MPASVTHRKPNGKSCFSAAATGRSAAARSRAIVADALADGGLEQLGRFTNSRGESPTLRYILLTLIEEYARHVGHADLIRESVDGLTGESPPD